MIIFPKKYDNFFELMINKEEFMIMVFSNLIFQIVITFYFMEKTTIIFTVFQQFILYSVVIILFLLITNIKFHPIIKFTIFTLFSITMGLILSFLKKTINHELLQRSIIILASLFLIFFMIGIMIYISGIKISFHVGVILFYLLLILIIFDHLSALYSSSVNIVLKIIAFFALIITSLYIIFDTYVILQKKYSGDFISASLDYYIDIFFYFDYFTIGIRYLLYILNLFTAFIGIKQLK